MNKTVEQTSDNPVVDIVLDTVKKNKQAFIFVNTKKSAEKCAEDIAKNLDSTPACELIAEKILNILESPTKQCKRLADCVKKGSAFHHSGLHSRQREIIEEEFRLGNIRFISCTPTLAAGISMPAFRAIIRDVQRFGKRGMEYIPVLEFHQMAGRAGRPEFDDYGEAIVIAKENNEKEFLTEKYIKGEPEDIYSKLSVEPVLRTYVLSLISSGVVNDYKSLIDFFSQTFWSFQFKELKELSKKIDSMLELLIEWGFIQKIDDNANLPLGNLNPGIKMGSCKFAGLKNCALNCGVLDPAQFFNKFRSSYLGKRIAELYIDPYTANEFVKGVKRAGERITLLGLLHLICNSLEMRPLLSITNKDFEFLQEKILLHQKEFLSLEPSEFEPEHDDWLKAFKTALMLQEWCEESDENYLLKNYNVRPGESRAKINIADWLLYALSEIARIEQKQVLLSQINKARTRLKYGIREELLPLVKFKGVGRIKARILYKNGIKDLRGVKDASLEKLKQIIGEKLAISMKEQVGECGLKEDSVLNDFECA